MKKKVFYIVLLFNIILNAQVGIGTTIPNGALDINSNSQGLIPPRVALTSTSIMLPVSNPSGGSLVNGTVIYNTAVNGSGTASVTPGFYYWENSNWIRLKEDSYFFGSFTSLSTQKITLSSGQKISFGTTVCAGNTAITYDSVNKSFTLLGNKTYRIDFSAGWIHFLNGTYIRFALYDNTANTVISPTAHLESVTNTNSYSGSASLTHFVTVGSTPLVISVVTVGGNTTNSDLGDTGTGTALPIITIQSI